MQNPKGGLEQKKALKKQFMAYSELPKYILTNNLYYW